jgi:hypothetical protein
MLVILVAAVIAGYLGGILAQGFLLIVGVAVGLNAFAQLAVLIAYCGVLAAVGLWGVSRLAAGFHL